MDRPTVQLFQKAQKEASDLIQIYSIVLYYMLFPSDLSADETRLPPSVCEVPVGQRLPVCRDGWEAPTSNFTHM